ncbi:MAG: outer membrane protein assembly factor BamB family protein [Candidatus Aquicultorales bacterium]
MRKSIEAGKQLWEASVDDRITGIMPDPSGGAYLITSRNTEERTVVTRAIRVDEEGNKKWEFPDKKLSMYVSIVPTENGQVLNNGRLYVLSNEQGLVALDKNGEVAWRYKPKDGLPTKAVASRDGTVYLVSRYGQAKDLPIWPVRLEAVSPSGKVLWKQALESIEAGDESELLLAHGSIYYQESKAPPSTSIERLRFSQRPHPYSLVVFDKDGKKLWRKEVTNGSLTLPFISKDMVYYSADKLVNTDLGQALQPFMYAVRASDGKEEWSLDSYPNGGWAGTPVVTQDGSIWINNAGTAIERISPDGKRTWAGSDNNAVFLAALEDGSAVASAGDVGYSTGAPMTKVYALRPDGSKLWEHSVEGLRVSAIEPTQDLIYCDTINPGTNVRTITALSFAGKPRWTFTFKASSVHEKKHLLASDGSTVYASVGNKVYAINARTAVGIE